MVLSRDEFAKCLKSDTFLAHIDIPNKQQAISTPPYDYTNSSEYADNLFDKLDTHNTGYLNFHAYMTLRLFTFSWRRCSVGAPFIEETNFECAIEIASGWKTMPRNVARKIYYFALELSGLESARNLDFISYVSVAESVRLYGKINGKEDNDITRNEFNLALDNNILPMRYNQDTINIFFKLIEEYDKPSEGLDISSFCFYDFWLKLFYKYQKTKMYFLNSTEFSLILDNPLYPRKMREEILLIPQNNLTDSSYDMYTYLNTSNYHDESDHFLKSFLETSSKTSMENSNHNSLNVASQNKWNLHQATGNNNLLAFNKNDTMKYIFNAIDANSDGLIDFYDFCGFIQINYIFSKNDPFKKGRIVAADLFDNFTTYSDYPLIGELSRLRAKKFSLYPQDLYVDLFSTLLALKIDDIINLYVRRLDKTTLFEVELRNVFKSVNRQFMPNNFLNKCLRGLNPDNIPLYDWECAFVQGEIRTLKFFENSMDKLTVKTSNLTLFNTMFHNIDPSLPQDGAVPTERPNSLPNPATQGY